MTTLQTIFKLLLGIAVPLAAFATGLRGKDPFWLWKRPQLLGRSLLAVLIIVPITAVLLAEALAPTVTVRAGLVVAIVSIGIGPFAIFKRTKAADEATAYEIGLDVTLLALAILYMPAAVAVHSRVFHHAIEISPMQVAKVVLPRALVPLVLGIAAGQQWPRVAARIDRYAGVFLTAVTVLILAVALVIGFRELLGLKATGWLACAAVSIVALGIGHVLGGPKLETRMTLAAFSSMRFPGLALLLASAIPGGERLIPVVIAYLIVTTALLAGYALAAVRSAGPPLARPSAA